VNNITVRTVILFTYCRCGSLQRLNNLSLWICRHQFV
jgi:hypothetical protein